MSWLCFYGVSVMFNTVVTPGEIRGVTGVELLLTRLPIFHADARAIPGKVGYNYN